MNPCGGGFEYLHRDPASRRRRRKGTTQIWDSIRWSRVPRHSNPRKTRLARAAPYTKHRLVLSLERAPQKDRNYHRLINIWLWAADWARHQDLLIDWPSVAMWLWLAEFLTVTNTICDVPCFVQQTDYCGLWSLGGDKSEECYSTGWRVGSSRVIRYRGALRNVANLPNWEKLTQLFIFALRVTVMHCL
jgi:hypothetical protein